MLEVLDSDLGDTSVTSHLPLLHTFVLRIPLGQAQGKRHESGQNAQTYSPNTMGRFKSSPVKVTHSPSACGRLCLPHSCDPASMLDHMNVGKEQLSGKLISRMETSMCLGGRVRFWLLGEKN